MQFNVVNVVPDDDERADGNDDKKRMIEMKIIEKNE